MYENKSYTKSMPGIGKSGNCRRAFRRSIFVRASSVALGGAAVDSGSILEALSVDEETDKCGVCWVVIVGERKR